jgi:hypothetical protein
MQTSRNREKQNYRRPNHYDLKLRKNEPTKLKAELFSSSLTAEYLAVPIVKIS